MMAKCEKCQHPLTLGDSDFFCERCGAHYARQAQCPDCHQPLQVLKACGAVDYFCQHGHGLISKKRVEFVPLNYQA
ncbi:MAG: zinc ribbon domain-containing protein [Mixta calida]|nr:MULTISPECIES: zinc ribbon domain-containing protein [Mixta]MDU3816533.1 zinc ribbon domain-containing protein [Pantoea sp.]MCR1568647.1 zinc ribbon domain-containing protein [Mixta sp.]MDU3075854.1 zinc ribbon domain-containing protein [Mixta calida]MDU4289254.1 zinc ribbon domain-containing protein [Mixta calida]MDU4942213.1 zinc ribbon domain-containing protein [Mixta calida]